MTPDEEREYMESERRTFTLAEKSAGMLEAEPIIKPPQLHWDRVERPHHYCSHEHTTAEIAVDWELDFFLGNVLKYIERHQLKGDMLGDLRKAKKYLEMKIELLEKGKLEDTISHG